MRRAISRSVPRHVKEYSTHLKEMYAGEPIMQEDPWPPPPSEQYIELVLIEKIKDGESTIVEDKRINLDEVFDVKKPFKMLLDGDPGTGKSTLCRKFAYNWSQDLTLHDFIIVALIPLRDPDVASSESIDDFFYHDNQSLQESVVKYVRQHQGFGVLLIFDGYDELTHLQRTKSSLFLQVLQGKKLSKCSVLVTSRPYASQKVEHLHTLTRHMELLGFNEENVHRCISSSLNDTETRKLIYALKNRPQVLPFCKNPLTCAIIIFVYKHEGHHLPSTLTEIYTSFFSNILTRETDIQGLESDIMLEEDLMQLAKLSFETYCGNAKIVFDEREIIQLIGPGFKSLGLLTATKHYVTRGRHLNYQFTHVTIQEFLAAKWIHSKFTPKEAGEFLNANLSDERLKYTLLFFAGLSKLDNEEYQQAFCTRQLDLCTHEETLDHSMFVRQIQMIHEAQNCHFCPLLSSMIKQRILKIITSGLTMEIAAPLAYFIGNSYTDWEIIDITLIHSSFTQFLLEYRAYNKPCTVKYFNLTHQPIWGDYGCCTINDIEYLLIRPPFVFLTSLSVCSLVDEQMAYKVMIDDEKPFSALVLNSMIAGQRLKHLTLRGVIGATNEVLDLHNAIFDGLNNSLESIDIKSQTHSIEVFTSLFRLPGFGSPSITDLYLQVQLPFPEGESAASFESIITEMIMVRNCNLRTLCIRSSYILADGMFGTFLPGYKSLLTVSTLLRGISMNCFLRRLTLGDVTLDPCGVTALLTNNCTLEIFNLIFVPLTNELLSSLSCGLKQNHSLVKLCLIDYYDSFNPLATLIRFHRHSVEIERMTKENYSAEIQFHSIFEGISYSNVKTLILDINPGALAFNKPKFPHALAQMLIRNTKLETFTLNYSYFSDDYLLQIARALVLNGRKKEINLTLGTGLSPSLYSRDPLMDSFQQSNLKWTPTRRKCACFSVEIRPDQEQFIQHEVDEFKQAMQTTMLKTLLFILNNRIQRQAIHLEQTCFNTFLLTLLKTLQCRTQRQAIYLEQTCFNTFILTLLKTLQWRVNRQKIFLAMTFQ